MPENAPTRPDGQWRGEVGGEVVVGGWAERKHEARWSENRVAWQQRSSASGQWRVGAGSAAAAAAVACTQRRAATRA